MRPLLWVLWPFRWRHPGILLTCSFRGWNVVGCLKLLGFKHEVSIFRFRKLQEWFVKKNVKSLSCWVASKCFWMFCPSLWVLGLISIESNHRIDETRVVVSQESAIMNWEIEKTKMFSYSNSCPWPWRDPFNQTKLSSNHFSPFFWGSWTLKRGLDIVCMGRVKMRLL